MEKKMSNRKLFVVEVESRLTLVVVAVDEAGARKVAEDSAGEAYDDTSPEWSANRPVELRSAEKLPEGWAKHCLPYIGWEDIDLQDVTIDGFFEGLERA